MHHGQTGTTPRTHSDRQWDEPIVLTFNGQQHTAATIQRFQSRYRQSMITAE